MSYIVEYTPQLRDSYPMQQRNKRRFPTKTLVIITSVLIILYTLNTTGILRYIIPGDPAVTAGAFSSMVDQVRAGESVSEVIFQFFKNVILGGMQ